MNVFFPDGSFCYTCNCKIVWFLRAEAAVVTAFHLSHDFYVIVFPTLTRTTAPAHAASATALFYNNINYFLVGKTIVCKKCCIIKKIKLRKIAKKYKNYEK